MSGFGGAVKLSGESEYRKALKQITTNLKEVSSEMKLVSAQFDKNDRSTEAVRARTEALSKQLTAQKNALATLQAQYKNLTAEQDKNIQKHNALEKEYKDAQDELKKIGDELGKDSAEYKLQAEAVAYLAKEVDKSSQANAKNEQTLSGMRTEMNNLKTSIAGTETEMSKADDSADDLADSTKKAGDSAEKAGDGFTVFKGVLANLASEGIKKALDGLSQLGKKLVDVGKQAYSEYANYEQLTGGVETLFGKSSDELMKYAQNAFKTAGMSANEYMETVTSFSSALIKSLGGDTEKAVEYADKALRDMSDNANKMGTSIDSIQAVYSSLARGIYTTLDNLKLGFAGTKTGAEELLKEAEKLDKNFKAQRDSSGKLTLAYADMVDAIHIVQTQMGITGTTAKEAESTIEGSTKAMKASWKNLLVAVADDNANMKKAVKDFTNSAETYLKNAVPRIKKIIEGIFTAGKKLAKQYMPEIYNTVVPTLEKITKAIGNIVQFISKNFSTIAPIVLTAVTAFTTFNAVMKITATVNAVTSALSSLTAGVGLATKAQTAYNAVLASNPIGAILTAVVALTVAIVALANSESIASQNHRELREEMEETAGDIQSEIDSWNALSEAKRKEMNAGLSELEYYQTLKDELKSITDSNGKVKEGYEERADFIISELNKAYDIEITKTDNIIDNYIGIMNAMDELYKKKKAQIILDAQEAMAIEARGKQKEYYEQLIELEDDLASKKDKVAGIDVMIGDAEEKLNEMREKGYSQDSKRWRDQVTQLAILKQEKVEAQKDVDLAQANVDALNSQIEASTLTISQYEKNLALAHAGLYEEMTDVDYQYAEDFTNVQDIQMEALQNSYDEYKRQYDNLREMKKKYGTDIVDLQLIETENQLNAIENQMKAYQKTTGDGLEAVEIEWNDSLDDQLSAITGHDIDFEDAGGGLVDVYIDGIKSGEQLSKDEVEKLATDAIKEITKQEGKAKSAGEDLIKGINKGIGNLSYQRSALTTINNFGSKLLSQLKSSLKEASPSKATEEMGLFLDKGLDKGVKKGTTSTLRQVADFGKSVLGAFDDSIGEGFNLSGLSASALETMPSVLGTSLRASALAQSSSQAQEINSIQNLTQAFTKAMEGMKIEMGEDGFASFVVDTVTNEIYK